MFFGSGHSLKIASTEETSINIKIFDIEEAATFKLVWLTDNDIHI